MNTRLPHKGGAAMLVFLWLERHKMINLTKTFLFSLFFLNIMEFSNSLLDCSFVLFFTNTLQCKIFIFLLTLEDLSERLHGTGRSIRTIHIIFVTSLHDCKIVNTDYLLTLFYLEPRFHMESI